MSQAEHKRARGPFRADQLHSGDPYELSDGHAIYVAPTGGRGAVSQICGAEALHSDPLAKEVGIDAGFSPEPGTLRAPDIAVGNVPAKPGWVPGAPMLAVEYADTGQDEEQLTLKIRDLFAAGTRYLWVVRLAGARRIEVYEPGKPMRLVLPGEYLEAPGVLKNPVPCEAMYDPEASSEVAFRNQLERRGYSGLDAVRQEGEAAGAQAALLQVMQARGWSLTETQTRRVQACRDISQLQTWLVQAVRAECAQEVLGDDQR